MDQVIRARRSSVLNIYNKSDTDIQKDVDIILTSLEKQPHFPKIKDQVSFTRKIEVFLVFNKFHLEKTKKKLDLYYSYRNIYPEFFDNWDPCSEEFENAFTVFKYIPLPQLTKDLNRISYMEIAENLSSDQYNPLVHHKIFLMSLETQFLNEFTAGEILIYNCANVNLSMLKTLTPSLLKKAADINLKGNGVRFHKMHILYPPTGLSLVLNILRLLIKPKLYDRIILHNDLESLHKEIAKEYLPKNLGGSLPDTKVLSAEWYDMLKSNRINLMEEAKTRSDESKRIDKLNEDEFFGSLHGSFKKLEVD